MNYDYDHERFVRKNQSIARGYGLEDKDNALEKKGFSRKNREEEASCFNCKYRNKCSEFRKKQTGGERGAVSYGGTETFICKRYEAMPVEKKGMSSRQIKSLLKNAKRGL